MKRGRWHWVGLVCVVACSRSNEPLPNKNTNWLNACESADDCTAGQACLCGICTTTCGSASECGREGVEASCVPVVDPRIEAQCDANDHGDAVAICAAVCEGPSDCEAIGPELACSQAVCVQSAFAAPDVGHPDARMSEPDGAVRDAVTGDATTASGAPDAEVADAMVDAASTPPDAGEDAGADAGALACAPCDEGWSCIDGVCAQILATDQPGLMAFVRDSERLYWVNYGTFDQLGNYQHDGSVVAIPIGGGEIVTLAEGLERPMGLQVDEGHAYWVGNFEPPQGETFATIMRVALSGGTPEPIANAPWNDSIAVDDTYVYFRGDDAAAKPWLKRVLKDGSAEAEELIALEPLIDTEAMSITVDGESLYWMSSHGAFGAPKDGGAVMFRTSGTPTSIFAVEAGAVYVASGGLEVRSVDGETLTLAVPSEGGLTPSGIAVDSGHVYWTWTYWDEAAKGGGLARSDKSPGDTEILWSSELLVNSRIVLDDAYVYLGIRGAIGIRGPWDPGQSMVVRIVKEQEPAN